MVDEDLRAQQLAEDRAKDNRKGETPPEKTGKGSAFREILGHPVVQCLIPLAIEMTPLGGILPSWTTYVIYTYFSEKKAGRSPNLSEYLTMGSAALTSDAIDWLELTGFGMIIAKGIDIPTVLFLMSWRMYKRITVGATMPTKPKITKK